MINRLLTHDSTRAEIDFPPDESYPAATRFANEFGNVQGCDHSPLAAS